MEIIIGSFTIVGVGIGALLQYIFTKFLEEKRHLRELKTKAFIDYMQCVSEQAQLHLYPDPDKTTRLSDIFARTADAKCRICLYGAPAVIEAFALFEKLGSNMKTVESRSAYIEMLKAMRRDAGQNKKINKKDVHWLLFGLSDNQ